MNQTENRPTVVAITGASGSLLGFKLTQALLRYGAPVELIISTKSYPVIADEMGLNLPQGSGQKAAILNYLELESAGNLLTVHSNKQLGASTASGTHLTQGMVIIPCSMSTLGKIASGISDNLVTRSADVTLKERRTLILVPRESPFNRIHLENMLKLTDMGARVIPPVLSFYQTAFHSLDGQMAYTVGKVMDHLGFADHDLYPRWTGESEEASLHR